VTVVTVVTVAAVAAECFGVEGIEHTSTLGLVCDRIFYERVSNDERRRGWRGLCLVVCNSKWYTGIQQVYRYKTKHILAHYDTAKEAAQAFDRAVVQHQLPSSRWIAHR